MQPGDGKSRQAAGYAAEARSDRLYRKMQQGHGGGSAKRYEDCSRNPLGVLEAQNHDG